MLIEDANHTIDIWIKELENYDFIQICRKPSPNSWSLGQVIMHLLADTNFYFEQIKICVSSNDHTDRKAAEEAKTMFFKNSFPDEIIEGASSNSSVPQPGNKEQLMSSLKNLKNEFNVIDSMISKSLFHGKTKHPGLGYFNADEWFQFTEMHLRHHLKQKERIDSFLKRK